MMDLTMSDPSVGWLVWEGRKDRVDGWGRCVFCWWDRLWGLWLGVVDVCLAPYLLHKGHHICGQHVCGRCFLVFGVVWMENRTEELNSVEVDGQEFFIGSSLTSRKISNRSVCTRAFRWIFCKWVSHSTALQLATTGMSTFIQCAV